MNAHNGEVVDNFTPGFFYCPSSPVSRTTNVGSYKVAAPSYAGISGATNDNGFVETRVNPCVVGGQISAGGVLIPNKPIRLQRIKDGTAKTLMVGEQSDYVFYQGRVPFTAGSGFNTGWLCGSLSARTPPGYVNPSAPSYNITTVRYPLNERRYELPGIYNDGGANNPLVSPHPGVVNLLYCDGSVHAASDSMMVDVLKSLATRDDETGMEESAK
jgi:prepilin-type processing-associated H-X9-DG protein